MMKQLLLSSALMLLLSNAHSQEGETEIRKVAHSLIETLTPLQQKRALLQFGDTSRIKWNNLPVGLRARAGVNIGNMSTEQRKLLHRILFASLSSQGYLKATSIMHLDNLLNQYYDTLYLHKEINSVVYQELRDLQWGHQNYYLAFFGNPDSGSDWGYKLEGHHLSINFTFHDHTVSITPMFVGTDPAEFPIGEYAGWRVLGKEEDYGFNLINSLPEAQKKKATMSTAVPEDIITSAESGKRLVDNWGIKASELNKEQQETIKRIIREFVFNLDYDKSMEEYNKINKAGINNVYFGWIGSYEAGKPHYYVLNGPTFLIEFDDRNGNHIHSIWREKGNEYGEDVLKKHYMQEHQKQ